jgi:pimeloyl-ACP methyl ester carboxylesterase
MDTAIPPDFYHPNATTLVVLLHAFASSPKRLTAVRATVKNHLKKDGQPTADILCPQLKGTGRFSFTDPNDIVLELLCLIDSAWEGRQRRYGRPYDSIILVGHSLGALLARKVYVCACGETEAAPFEKALHPCHEDCEESSPRMVQPRPWAVAVERIILFAGMNRGWTLSHHLTSSRALQFAIGNIFAQFLLLFGLRHVLLHIRRGAPFIAQLRLQWLAMRQRCQLEKDKGAVGRALVVQLLGTIDDLVAPDDNVDLATGTDFVYLEVPHSSHATVIDLCEAEPCEKRSKKSLQDKENVGEKRREVFLKALNDDPKTLSQANQLPNDGPLLKANIDVTDVIFVIHGIRDQGYWTRKIAQRVKRYHPKIPTTTRMFETETSSYGYFPMLPFFLPWKRRAKMEWLMDQYTEDRALYPNAEFSFVGHSNGTYALAHALEKYPACRFKRVVFAGSVVRTDYDWQKLRCKEHARQTSGQPEASVPPDSERRCTCQVQQVLNYVATADWVVAFFPRAWQMVGLSDLGSAGHDGFQEDHAPGVQQIKFVRGAHSAALDEALWDDIAAFIVDGTAPEPPSSLNQGEQSPLVRAGGRVAPLIWLAMFASAIGGAFGIWRAVRPKWMKSGALLLYLRAIWAIINRL